MNNKICIVIGSSRGLGAEMVKAFSDEGVSHIIGVARSKEQDCLAKDILSGCKNYTHIVADITLRTSVDIMRSAIPSGATDEIFVVFNAAYLAQDVRDDNTIDFPMMHEINKVGVDGLTNVLEAYETHWLKYGGVLTAVSSINALMPPVVEPRAAYAPTKAYLHMMLRALSAMWPKTIITRCIHLGQIEGSPGKGLLKKPSYATAAKFIVSDTLNSRRSGERIFPWVYRFVYPILSSFMSDRCYIALLKFFGVNKK